MISVLKRNIFIFSTLRGGKCWCHKRMILAERKCFDFPKLVLLTPDLLDNTPCSGVGFNSTDKTFTLLHKHQRLPRQLSQLQRLPPGCRACRAGYAPHRCLVSSVFPPGLAERREGRILVYNNTIPFLIQMVSVLEVVLHPLNYIL